MHLSCPNCELSPDYVSDFRRIIRHGVFYRTSDSRSIERYRCLDCKKTFSKATKNECFGQKKRQKNRKVLELFGSGLTLRGIGRFLRINRTTVARKLQFLAAQKREALLFDTAFSTVHEM